MNAAIVAVEILATSDAALAQKHTEHKAKLAQSGADKSAKVKREFQRRLKIEFDRRGIEFPFPHRTIYVAPDSAPVTVRLQPAEEPPKETPPADSSPPPPGGAGKPEA